MHFPIFKLSWQNINVFTSITVSETILIRDKSCLRVQCTWTVDYIIHDVTVKRYIPLRELCIWRNNSNAINFNKTKWNLKSTTFYLWLFMQLIAIIMLNSWWMFGGYLLLFWWLLICGSFARRVTLLNPYCFNYIEQNVDTYRLGLYNYFQNLNWPICAIQEKQQ